VRYRAIAKALEKLRDETVVDGEVVALDDSGRPSFNTLQNFGSSTAPIFYYAFDVLILSGKDVRFEPLDRRRELLTTKVLSKLHEPVPYSSDLEASLPDLIRSVREQGLEGLIAKRRTSVYEAGQRSGAWLKMRVNRGQEFVIADTRWGRRTLTPRFWVLRARQAHLCGADSQRIHAGVTAEAV
jgi:ATP-dependent DNA ligase